MPLNLPPPKASTSVGVRQNGHSVPAISRDEAAEASTSQFQLPPGDTLVGTLPSFAAAGARSGLSLPPPKTKSKQLETAQPKRFVLDLAKAPSDHQEEEEQPAKRQRMDESGAGAGAASSILGSLPPPRTQVGSGILGLPPPRSAASSVAASSQAGKGSSSSTGPSLLPHVLKNSSSKGKASHLTSKSSVPLMSGYTADSVKADEEEKDEEQEQDDAAVLNFFGLAPDGDEEDEDEEGSEGQEQGVASGPAGGIDFFGLGGSSTSKASAKPANAAPARTAAALTAPSSITTKPAVPASNKVSTSSVKISAAPTTVAPELSSNYYATLPLPTPGDPYPGFYKKPDGTWAAKRPEEWASYMEAMNEWNTANQEAQGQAAKETEEPELPKDFEQVGIERSVEVRAAELRKAAGFDPTKPDLISDEEKKRIEEEKMRAKANQKKVSYVARSRHQLSTLIQDAQVNRQELEDRIAQHKSNKRTGGSKYGF